MTADQLREFFGWCSVLHLAVLVVSSISLMAMREGVTRIHAAMFDLDPKELPGIYFRYLAYYKIAALVTAFVPWLALTITT